MAAPPTIVVAGDVCIDWLSVPLDPLSLLPGQPQPQNWQLRGGRRMFARHGGAWLTAELTAAAVEGKVFGPQRLPQDDLDSVSPDRLIHSLVTLDRFGRGPGGRSLMLGVSAFEGFAGPGATDRVLKLPLDAETPDEADIVVLDDAGNGFRNDPSQWPRALFAKNGSVVVYKLRQPLEGAELGKSLRAGGLGPRTVLLLNVEELRAESEGSITRALSWERTATNVVDVLHRTPQLFRLLDFAHLIIPLGMEGVLHVEAGSDRVGAARLWYWADKIEGDLVAQSRGTMTGLASAFTAAFVAQLAQAPAAARLDRETIGQGIRTGMSASWRLFELGFGRCHKDGAVAPPQYPGKEIFQPGAGDEIAISSAVLNPYPKRMNPSGLPNVKPDDLQREIAARFERDMAEFNAWSILHTTREAPYAQLAEQVVRHGFAKVLPSVPVARFSDLELIERQEIEAYRTIRNLIREFLANKKPERPLCLAVFGAPGAGKSFGVVQVAKELAKARPQAGDIERYNFNVSQWQSPHDLAHALHHVRDSALRGNVPLVFFDEFDSPYAGELGWLKYFLAPMQDGVFNDGGATHMIGRAIFVFAGGTSFSFNGFQKRGLADDPLIKAAKAPDFLSRLRGYVDVFGVGAPTGVQLLRRALLLRSFLSRKCRQIFDAKTGEARVSSSVLRAFLNVSKYSHGVRSIEAILDMSRLDNVTELTASLLPPANQLELHVPAEDFLRLLNVDLNLGEHLERLARFAHEDYLKGQEGKRAPDHPSMQPWSDLIPMYKNSNREQVAHLPVKLAAVGCAVQPSAEPADFRFTDDELTCLAKMEHDRWMEERRPVQPAHPSMVPWDELSEDDKRKDYDSMQALPAHLKKVGLEVVRLQ